MDPSCWIKYVNNNIRILWHRDACKMPFGNTWYMQRSFLPFRGPSRSLPASLKFRAWRRESGAVQLSPIPIRNQFVTRKLSKTWKDKGPLYRSRKNVRCSFFDSLTFYPLWIPVCAGDADVIFESVDGVQFRLHRKNLEAHTGGFPAPEFETNDEITHLTEPANILRILFQFVYPRRQPDLERLDFEVVAAVSEAAEKYEVFSAMPICNVRMRWEYIHS